MELLLATLLAGRLYEEGVNYSRFGLFLGSVELFAPVSGAIRFTLGFFMLQEGFDFVTLATGLLGIGEVS